jgi:hypothetical protein
MATVQEVNGTWQQCMMLMGHDISAWGKWDKATVHEVNRTLATVHEVNGAWQQCMRLMGHGNSA